MRQIEPIYNNNSGMSFFWKQEGEVLSEKVQMVFKETGFYFSVDELNVFLDLIEDSFNRNGCCAECAMNNKCARFLLKTPCPQIDLAVSIKELDAIKDLVEGTLFKIKLEEYIYGVGKN